MSDSSDNRNNGLSSYGPSSSTPKKSYPPSSSPSPSNQTPQGYPGRGVDNSAGFSQQIQQNIQKKASSQEFNLTIEDQDFYTIPDFDVNSQPPVYPSSSQQQRSVSQSSHSSAQPTNRSSSGQARPSTAQRSASSGQSRSSTAQRTASSGQAPRKGQNPNSSNGARSSKNSKKKKASKNTRLFGSMLYVLIVVGVSVFLSIFILQSMTDYLGLKSDGEITEVAIPENATSYEIGKILKDNKIINQPLTFSLYYNWKGIGEKFNGGESYYLDPKSAYDQIFSVLTNSADETSTVKITIAEGKNIREIGAILEENGVCSSADFIAALNQAYEKKGYAWMEEIPDPKTNNRYFALEGYIFPNTHTMLIGESAESVAKRFLDDFNSQYNSIIQPLMTEKGLNLDQTLILASLIQKECSGYTDAMYNVSQIFHNRLADGSEYPNLQSDVTINYVEQFIKPYETQQSQVELYASVYNTYKCVGLPVGPIANPGMDAIRAAVYPNSERSADYFFITDANNDFYYASTYKQHLANITQASKVTNESGEAVIGGVATE